MRRGASPTDPEPGPISTRDQDPRGGREPDTDPGWVQTTAHAIGTMQALLRRIGTALIGGDFTGSGRGANAVDLQGFRTDPSNVASGLRAICLGSDNEASGEDGIAIGYACQATATRAVAVGSAAHAEDIGALSVGQDSHAAGTFSTALGPGAYAGSAILRTHNTALGGHAHGYAMEVLAAGIYAHALGNRATALGPHARARLADTTNISGVLITRRSDLAQDAHEDALSHGYLPLLHGAAALVTITSDELDLTTAAQATVTFPTGSRFLVRELHLIVTAAASVTGQPSISSGTAAAPPHPPTRDRLQRPDGRRRD